MKAAVWYGKDDLRIEDVPLPKIDNYECLLAVKYCGLCKTDVKKIKDIILGTKGKLEPPRVFGHEIVGEIYKVGKKVKKWKEGDRVAIYHHVPCNNCYYCYNLQFTSCETYKSIDTSSGIGKPSGGGFGEFVKVPYLILEKGTIKIPDGVDFETAVFMEPTNCCLKGIDKANIKVGDTVAIIGQGPIGLTLDQLAILNGAKVIGVDLVDYRLRKAESFGVEHTINAAKVNSAEIIKEITNNIGVDKTIVAVEEPAAIKQAIKYTRPGGIIVFFSEFGGESGHVTEKDLGREIVDGIYGKELTVVGSYSSSFLRHLDAANLVFSGKINTKDLISHIVSLEELPKMIDLVSRRRPTPWDMITNEMYISIDVEPPQEERTFKVLVKP
jgi:L-iditol 2-dehydrogenase